jgi:murein DD-endopeptidase MepM/ murein hydrolase activator NlpD
MVSEFAPSGLEIRAHFEGDKGEQVTSTTLPVRQVDEATSYGYPLEGNWYMRGIPSALSHHRWGLATEFAVDFFKVDAEGRIAQGDRIDPQSYYGYGEAVLAAADGVVEMVVRGMKQDRAARMRREGETDEAFSKRIGELDQRAMQEHGLGGATGNLIVLRHPSGQRTAYAHLRTGSLRVKEGDSVSRGQVIAEVGDTGDSAAVHLHFQVMEESVMRAIPFNFDSVRVVSRELGSWIEPLSAGSE